MKREFHLAAILLSLSLAGAALAQQDSTQVPASPNKLTWQFSPFTYHYSYDEKHRPVHMIGLEREKPGDQLDGVTFFTNSFGQDCVYVYPWGGVYHNFYGIQPLSFKWTAGLLYGYVAPYENKVPLNHNGFSPGAIIAFEYKFQSGWSAQVDMLGTAALMFQANVPFK
ncbi:hypothetical protein [Rhodoferax sp.]|uniref:hypothetical protein n=1 Tax=Rhodoferax sp. TaxID=50421 RepID=UPI002848C57C|nr:hypothetical protein [Rhodoferax sp.]MDR3370067.1 hypothetical protein [Rhodoferax sp.]